MTEETNISAKSYLIKRGRDSDMNQRMIDIITTKTRQVTREMNIEDLMILSRYFNFPTNRNGGINVKASRVMVEQFIISNPCFRSSNSKIVVDLIKEYFENNPNEPRYEPIVPEWSKHIHSNSNQEKH